MKNLNFLSNLCGLGRASQSSDVGYDSRRSDLRRSPSGLDAKWKQNPFMRFAVVLTLIFTIGSGNAWGAAPTLSDLVFSTESSVRIVNEDFSSASATDKTAKMTADASLSGFGAFNKGYNNSTSNHYAIESSVFSSNALKITMGSGSPCGVAISGKTFGTTGAYRFRVTKTAKMYAGIYAEGATSTAYAKANASVYIQANAGAISISKNTSSGNWQSVGTYTSNTYIDICVIYNNTTSPATYGNSISLAAKTAHVYIDGTCVMNGENPKAFTISGLTLSTFRVYPIASDGNVASIDDLQIWNALPTAAATTTVTASPTSITFANNTLDGSGEASGSSTVDLSVSNGNKSGGNYLWVVVESDNEDDCEFTINSGAYSYGSGNNTSIDDLSVEYYAISAGTWDGRIIAQGYNSSYEAVNCTIPLRVTITAPACSVNPSSANATINSSFVLTSLTDPVPVSSGTWGAGSNCSWTDYGFVWGTSSSPTVSNNKVQVGTSGNATSWTTGAGHQVQPSGSTTPTAWVVGNTYYVKAYGKNGKAGAAYVYSSGAASFVLHSITFNSNGGTSVGPWYVKGGQAYSAPSPAPTKTGYNFVEWCSNEGLTTPVNWSSTIGANKVYYAKWTAKTTTISFNQTSGTGGQTGTLTATYGSAMPSAPVTCPTRDGYDFGGYYDGSGGTGTQYYTNTGASAKNWDKENASYTLHAKWTLKSYTVTWKVNNENYSAGGSDNVTHGNHITTLPTAPNRPTYGCGDVFVGWTNVQNYVHGTSPLYTTAAEFPDATGDQVFYAVYADYTTE